ncbi:MAG TPA: hypothetical protein VHT28_18915 [Silvibacterium sp.]|nr:hypothetical protein [Silvibacterium sp.]
MQMIRLGKSSLPLDLMTYRHEDEQPGVFLLQEDARQAMLAVFNWSERSNSHEFSFSDLALQPDHHYHVLDVFKPEEQPRFNSTGLQIEKLPVHSVELFKILDDSIPAQPPSVVAQVPTNGKVSQDLLFTAAAPDRPVPAIAYHWDFGDGVITDHRDACLYPCRQLCGSSSSRGSRRPLLRKGLPSDHQWFDGHPRTEALSR